MQNDSFCTWMMIRRQTPAPISAGSPYMPVMTYTIACVTVITIANTVKYKYIGSALFLIPLFTM